MVKLKCCRGPSDIKDLWVTSHRKLSDFYASSWQGGESPLPLLVVRLLGLLCALAILSWALYEGFNLYWLLFLTNWGLLLVTAMFISGVTVSIAAVLKKIPDEGDIPWYVSLYWLLHNIAIGVSLIITALYWVLLYNPEMMELVPRLFVLDLMTHGMNSVLVMVELVSSRTPVKLLHIYQPLGVGLWYGVFTWIYYITGGTDSMGEPYIYEILDWRYSRRCIIIISIAAAGLIGIYCFLYGFAFCRDRFSNFLFRTHTIKLPFVPPDASTIPPLDNFV